jgi:hypothetical protein
MIPLWKGKNPNYFRVIRSKVKVTITINIIFDNGHFHIITLFLFIGSLPNLTTWLPCGRGRILFILGSKVKVTVTINRIFDNRVVSAWYMYNVTLVLYIGYLPNLTTWFPCGRGRTLFILGSLGQRSRSLTINIIFDNRVVSAR